MEAASLLASTSEAAASTGSPVRTKLYRRSLAGVPTDFAFCVYADTTLLFCTQTGTAGTMFSATQDAAFDGSTTYTTQVLLGARDCELLMVCVRQIVELAGGAGYRKPMAIGLGLKQPTMAMIKELVAAIAADNPWS